ncbi:MAG: anthranilate synthase component I family protein, partial [Elusimicrobiota bacterium]
MIHPGLPEFKRLAKGCSIVPVSLEFPADELTPMALFRAQYARHSACFLLESVEGGEHLGRYSFVGFDPYRVARARGEKGAWKKLRALMADHRAPEVPGLPRFYGGAVGFATYDMARHFEDLPRRTRDDLKLPDYVFMFTRDMFIFDHLNHTVRLVRCVRVPRNGSLEKLHAAAGRDLLRLARSIRLKPLKLAPMAEPRAGAVPEDPAERRAFMAKVEKAKEYISAGDVIQVVLSRRRAFAAKADPLEIYRALRRINPSPYMYFLKDGKTQVVGSSPEMLVRLEGRRAETRPIAGTRRRSADAAADQALEKELLADAKERAEHLMLVDLSRNDLGRVCRPGTVRVPNFMFVERYS